MSLRNDVNQLLPLHTQKLALENRKKQAENQYNTFLQQSCGNGRIGVDILEIVDQLNDAINTATDEYNKLMQKYNPISARIVGFMQKAKLQTINDIVYSGAYRQLQLDSATNELTVITTG